MLKVAVYGKGGIGKSTVTSNLAAAFAAMGKRVIQIGCDPKADSTINLLGGEPLRPVMNYMREEDEEPEELDQIAKEGFGGVLCIETGGPTPGLGCAGRGIIAIFQLLEDLRLFETYKPDVVLYDVLGDVVCGGFAAPIREGYAEKVLIVTSGEKMALYAANNILKGVVSYSDERNLLGGFVFNHIREQEEECIAEEFTNRVKGKMAAIIRESKELKLADIRKEIYTQNMSTSDSENWKAFCGLAEDICRTDERSVSRSQNKAEEVLPIPLNVDEIEKFGMEISRKLDKL